MGKSFRTELLLIEFTFAKSLFPMSLGEVLKWFDRYKVSFALP